ncbi:F0F1 ATP synthase subunit B [Phytomonospora endophytica]|nr:F0F1 ATP synthase subunit B [Phytomonospora endophytica]
MIAGLVLFALLCFVLMKYVFPRMEATFEARTDAIEGGLERAARAQEEAAALLAEYRAQLAGARRDAAAIREEARAEAHARRAEILAETERERDAIIAAGRDAMAADRRAVLAELRPGLGAIAVELAGRIVGESLAEEARERGTVERFLGELDDPAPAAT